MKCVYFEIKIKYDLYIYIIYISVLKIQCNLFTCMKYNDCVY